MTFRLKQHVPQNFKAVLVAVVIIWLLVQIFLWGISPDRVLNYYGKSNTFFEMLINSISTFLIPELCSVVIYLYYLKFYQRVFKISIPELSVQDLAKFSLKMIPAFLTAFFIFAPVTFSVRFLLRESNYSFYAYIDKYLSNAVSFPSYALYLPFVLFVGVCVEVSKIIRTYFRDKNRAASAAANAAVNPADVVDVAPAPRRNYPLFFKTQGLGGDLRLNVSDIYAIEVDNRYLFARYIGGRGLLGSSKMIEVDLDPVLFFRINRKYYIHLKFVRKYAYERESNRYRIRLNGEPEEFFMQQKSINAFKDALDAYEATVFKADSKVASA